MALNSATGPGFALAPCHGRPDDSDCAGGASCLPPAQPEPDLCGAAQCLADGPGFAVPGAALRAHVLRESTDEGRSTAS